MSLKDSINSKSGLKKFVHWLLLRQRLVRPRLWVRLFLNPIVHSKGKGSKISFKARLDLLPFNRFIIGRKSVIEAYSVINNGVGDVIIGENTFIGISNTIIGPVDIGNHIMFAQNIVMSGLNHSYQDINIPTRDQKVSTAKIIIADGAWIGANVVITAGTSIGKNSVIAAGSIVTKDVPPYSIVAGNPAKIIKSYNEESKSWDKK